MTKSDGNMEEVIAVARDVEKARSSVEEMAALNGIIADPTVSEEVRANAKANWSMKCAEVQGILTSNGGILQSDRYAAKQADEPAKKKQAELVQKLSDTNSYVGEQLAKVEQDNRDIEQRRSGQAQQQGVPGQAQQAATVDVNGLTLNNAASNANAAQALLFGNNTYSGNTTIMAGTLNVSGANSISNISNAGATVNSGSNTAVLGNQPTVTAGSTISNGTMQQGVNTLNLSNGSQTLGVNNSINFVSNSGQNLRWNANPTVSGQPNATTSNSAVSGVNTVNVTGATGVISANSGTTSNFYLNDNVVLQQAKMAKGTQTLTKNGSGTLTLSGANTYGGGKGDAAGKMLPQKDELSMRDREDKAKAPATKSDRAGEAKGEKEKDMKQDQSRSLSYARGNRAQQAELAELAQAFANNDGPQAPKPTSAQPISEARPQGAPMQPAGPAPSLIPGGGALPVPSPSVVPPGAMPPQAQLPQGGVQPRADGVVAAPVSAEQKAIQQLGRLSLSVDFPTQGHVHHFQKTKASAVLEISFSDPQIGKRWVRIAIFAGLALLLAFAGRVVSARRAQRGI